MVLASRAGAKPSFPTTLLKGVNKIIRHLFDPQPMGFLTRLYCSGAYLNQRPTYPMHSRPPI
jgi:hypothetical protein